MPSLRWRSGGSADLSAAGYEGLGETSSRVDVAGCSDGLQLPLSVSAKGQQSKQSGYDRGRCSCGRDG